MKDYKLYSLILTSAEANLNLKLFSTEINAFQLNYLETYQLKAYLTT